jgi:hypothetical protein
VVFDERVFPFASLCPNAGARLKTELTLLPDVLHNLNSSFGDAHVHDHHLPSPMPANVVSTSVKDLVSTEQIQSKQVPILGGTIHISCAPRR